jgi:spore coat polysaccharide biosynthesis protein SpsF
VEVVEAAALFDAEREAAATEEREHITTFLYRHPERFSIFEPMAPASATLADAHVSVDTREDFDRIRRIFEALYVGRPLEAEEVVLWLQRQDGGVPA